MNYCDLIYSYSLGCFTMGLAFSIKEVGLKYNISIRHLRISPELICLFYGILIVYSGYKLYNIV